MQILRAGWQLMAMGLLLTAGHRGALAAAAEPPKSIADWEREAAAVEARDPDQACAIRQKGLEATGADHALVEGAQFTHYKVAARLSARSEDKAALAEFAKAMAGDWQSQVPWPAEVLCRVAVAHAWLNEWRETRDAAEAAMRAVPLGTDDAHAQALNAWAQRLRAVAFFMLGDTARADENWEAARHGTNPPLGASPFDPAQEPFNRAVAEAPDDAAGWQARAAYLSERYAAAVASDPARVGILGHAIDDPGRAEGGRVRAGTRSLINCTDRLNRADSVLYDAAEDLYQAELRTPDPAIRLARARLLRKEDRRTPGPLTSAERAIANEYRSVIRQTPDNLDVRWERAQWILSRLPLLPEDTARPAAPQDGLALEFNQDLSRLIIAQRPEAARAHLLRLRWERSAHPVDAAAVLADARAIQSVRPQSPADGPAVSAEDWADAAYSEGVVLESRAPADALAAYQRALGAGDPGESDRREVSRDLPIRAFRLMAATGDFAAAAGVLPQIARVIDDLTNSDRRAIMEASGETDGLTAEQARQLAAELSLTEGMVLDALGRTDEARAAVGAALAMAPAAASLVHGTRYDPAQPGAAPLPRLPAPAPARPEGTAEEWKVRGNDLLSKQQWTQAQSCYETALQIDPRYADAWCNHGAVNYRFGRLDLAKADLDRALELDPTHRFALRNRARVLMLLGDRAAAAADLKTIAAGLPANDPERPRLRQAAEKLLHPDGAAADHD